MLLCSVKIRMLYVSCVPNVPQQSQVPNNLGISEPLLFAQLQVGQHGRVVLVVAHESIVVDGEPYTYRRENRRRVLFSVGA